MKLAAFLLTGLLVSGCAVRQFAEPTRLPTQAEWAQRITTKYDNYKKLTTIEGAHLTPGSSRLFLRAVRSDQAEVPTGTAVYVMSVYEGNWRFYDTVHTLDGKRWTPRLIDRKVLACYAARSCMYAEHLLLDIDTDYLAANADEGVDFKLSGQGGEDTFYIPGSYIRAFLNQITSPS